MQELGSAEHCFRSCCKPRPHERAQSKVNLGAALVHLAKCHPAIKYFFFPCKAAKTSVLYFAVISRFGHVLNSAKIKPGDDTRLCFIVFIYLESVCVLYFRECLVFRLVELNPI